MGTFADLMALLMCFFVLLLSFSEMDVLKFKQIAGSMKFAFGVQNKIEVKDIPKGTSVIAMEFRPGRPEPTPIDTIQQQTTDMTQEMLEFQAGTEDSAGGRQKQRGEQRGGAAQQTASDQQSQSNSEKASQEEVAERMRKVAQKLEKQIIDGAIEIESLGQQITIRIRENGSFSAGSAFLQPQFVPILRKIGVLLADMPGDIEVSGHSDSQQISNELYRSNWDLSSQRAVAVAEELRRAEGFDESRMSVVGKADTDPMTDIDDTQNRSRNRRVEISINQGKPKISEPISVLE
ncbi:OmpA/MotB domain-containing protein [Paraglaciecola psychrophila 170]|uniref:OmpA/MotB domain-containing protein n=2 Tax=Paraglaciecola TaxID=1621534 RepID=M4RUT8_9ALTE|nr:OmpA/MotB domain-containing protein [Paraglaciecola psychrophila 170]